MLLTPPPCAADVSGTAAPEQPRCPAHPQAPGRAGAAHGVRPPGHLHRGAVPGWGAPVPRCSPPGRPPGRPADRGPAQGLLLPGRGDLPPPVQVSHRGATARPQSTAGKSAACFHPHGCPHSCLLSSSLLLAFLSTSSPPALPRASVDLSMDTRWCPFSLGQKSQPQLSPTISFWGTWEFGGSSPLGVQPHTAPPQAHERCWRPKVLPDQGLQGAVLLQEA